MILMLILFVLMLFALWLGSRHGGLALGAICGLALALMVFCFGLKPGTPPIDVMLIIVAAITCAGIMLAAGGILPRYPRTGAPRRVPLGLRLFLHPDLSFRCRDRQLRPIRHHQDR